MSERLRSYDGMREHDALLAIDGQGKWVERVEAEERIAALEQCLRELRDACLHALEARESGDPTRQMLAGGTLGNRVIAAGRLLGEGAR